MNSFHLSLRRMLTPRSASRSETINVSIPTRSRRNIYRRDSCTFCSLLNIASHVVCRRDKACLVSTIRVFYSNFKSSPNPLNSCTNTLNDSGTPALGTLSPFTIDSYVLARPMISSDLSVNNSCKIFDAPYASSAHTSISPKR